MKPGTLCRCVSRLSQTRSKASSEPRFTRKRFIAMNMRCSCRYSPDAAKAQSGAGLSTSSRIPLRALRAPTPEPSVQLETHRHGEAQRLAVRRRRERRRASHHRGELLVEDRGAGAAHDRDRGHAAAAAEAECDRAGTLNSVATRGGGILLVARQMRRHPSVVVRIRRDGLSPAAARALGRHAGRTRGLLLRFRFLLLELLLFGPLLLSLLLRRLR